MKRISDKLYAILFDAQSCPECVYSLTDLGALKKAMLRLRLAPVGSHAQLTANMAHILCKFFRVVAKKEVNMGQFDKSDCDFNCGLWLTMYYFQICSHRIGQVSNEEVTMLL